MSTERNDPLPSDEEMAKALIDAANNLADLMTKARKMGLEFSFQSIMPNDAGKFSVANMSVKKVIA